MKRHGNRKTIIRLLLILFITIGLVWLIGITLQGASGFMDIEEQQWMHENEKLD